MNNIKLSILVPVYNKKEYLTDCINSIISQNTNFDVNIIITDDCSTDGSLELACDFKNRYPNKIVVLPSEKNQGLLSNIIKAYEYLIENPSPYFCCLDADDYLTDMNFYQKAIDFLEKNNDFNIYASNTTYLNKKQKEVPNNAFFKEPFCISTFEDMLDQKAVLGNTISSVFRNCVINKGFIEKLRMHVGNHYCEHSVRDDDFRNRIHLENSKAYYVNEVVGFYRVTQSGLYQGSNKLKQVLLKIQSFIDMYYFFDKKYYKFVELALAQLQRINKEVLKYDMNNILDYPFAEIMQLCSILSELSTFNSELVKENIFDIKNKPEESKKKKNIFSRIFQKKEGKK